MADSAPDVVACIPAYNEESRIASVIVRAKRHVDAVVVCDDGSGDLTGEIAEGLGPDDTLVVGADDPEIVVAARATRADTDSTAADAGTAIGKRRARAAIPSGPSSDRFRSMTCAASPRWPHSV